MQQRQAEAPPSAWRGIEPIAPIMAFLALNRLGGLRWAVVGATIASLVVVAMRRRRGIRLGVVLPVLTVAIIARGVIGVITDSETVYFGLGIAGKFAVAGLLIGSALIGRPLANRGAHLLLDAPPAATEHHDWHRAMQSVTVVGGLYYLCSGAIDIALLQRNGVEGYVLLRFLANWPLALVAMVAALALTQRYLRQIPDLPPLNELFDERLEAFSPATSTTTESTDTP